MGHPEDLRKHPRIEIILKISYPSREAFLADYASNASASGLFIATEKPFEAGESMTLDLSFPGLLEAIRLDAVVRWVRIPEKGTVEQPAGVGVEFQFSGAEQEKQVADLLELLLSDSNEQEAQDSESMPEPFRALLVEDNPLVREMLMFAVRKYHTGTVKAGKVLELVEAENGQVACETLTGAAFDLAIVDYFMPVMDGLQLVRWIRNSSEHSNLPVIVVSTGGEEVRKEAEVCGADMYLDKPLMLSKLLQTMQQLLGVSRKRGTD
jgi:uncharacterized protein (TIGR02266 family)